MSGLINISIQKKFAGYYNLRRFHYIFYIVIGVLVTDLLLSNISLSGFKISSFWGVTTFIVLSITFLAGQYLILGFVTNRGKSIASKSAIIDRLNGIILIIQSVLAGLILVVILLMLLTTQYYSALLISALIISYSLAGTALGTLSLRFLSWYISSRSFLVMLYGLTSVALTVRIISELIVFYTSTILNVEALRNSQSDIISREFESGSLLDTMYYAYTISSLVSVLLLWLSTSYLLRFSYHKLGSVKYWILVIIFPIYFLNDFVVSEPVAVSLGLNSLNFYIFISFQALIGGILFGIPFLIIAKGATGNKRILRDYMIITANGLVLLLISTSADIDIAPYPPFALICVASVGLSSYVVLIGLYSSAVSIAADANLRVSVRRSALDKSKLLDNIGSAEMEQEIINDVTKQSATIEDETGVVPPTSTEDIREYLQSVLKEVKENPRGSG
ncbi:MAG: hypothetical protein M3297_08630 [Thermoproteota archaeon]|nr:hypothetical protein [Thermoproteota archaeon]